MPIRVEHGPSMIPVGQLAFQTGQLQYRNKRRTELERLAMQQAEMRQRAKMQQNQISASLRGQQMSQMGAMQRLAVGQQYGQVNSEQAYQRQLQLSEGSREHAMNLAEQYGENAIEHTKIRQNLADDADWKKAEWNWLVKTYDQDLNSSGQQHVQGLLSDRMRIQGDQRIREEDRPAALEQNMGQIKEAQNNPQFRVGRDQEVGYKETFGEMEDGNYTWNRTRVSNGKGEDDWTYKPNLTRMIPDPNWRGPPNEAPTIKSSISTQQWYTDNTEFFDIDGVRHKSSPDMATGQMMITEVDTTQDVRRQQDREQDAIEYDIDLKKEWTTYRTNQVSGGIVDYDGWETYSAERPNPYRDAPPTPPSQAYQQWSAGPQPVAPQPVAPQSSGLPGLGGGGYEGGMEEGMTAIDHFEAQEQRDRALDAQAQPIAPPDLNAPAGAEGTELVVLDHAEANQLAQAGHIPVGTIVQLPSGGKVPAGTKPPRIKFAAPKPVAQPAQQAAPSAPPQQVREFFTARLDRRDRADIGTMLPQLNEYLAANGHNTVTEKDLAGMPRDNYEAWLDGVFGAQSGAIRR